MNSPCLDINWIAAVQGYPGQAPNFECFEVITVKYKIVVISYMKNKIGRMKL